MSVHATTGKTSNEPLTQNEIGAYLNHAVTHLAETMEPRRHETATLVQFLVANTGDGSYCLIPVPDRIGLVVTAPARPGKFWPHGNMLDPAAAMRSFFEQGEVWEKMSDKALWETAAKAATQARLDGNSCRTLSRACASALAVRCGLSAPTVTEMV